MQLDATLTLGATRISEALLSEMPTARAALGVGGLSGFLYAIGGRHSSSVLATNERFTPKVSSDLFNEEP